MPAGPSALSHRTSFPAWTKVTPAKKVGLYWPASRRSSWGTFSPHLHSLSHPNNLWFIFSFHPFLEQTHPVGICQVDVNLPIKPVTFVWALWPKLSPDNPGVLSWGHKVRGCEDLQVPDVPAKHVIPEGETELRNLQGRRYQHGGVSVISKAALNEEIGPWRWRNTVTDKLRISLSKFGWTSLSS